MEHSSNMKEITDLLRGKLHEQRDVLNFAKKLLKENAERNAQQCNGAAVISKCEEFVEKRDQAQKNTCSHALGHNR